MNNKGLFNKAILYSIGEVIPRALSFLLLPVLTAYITAEEYGIISYTNSAMTFVFVIASLSLNTFLLRHFFLEKNPDKRRDLVGSVFSFVLIFNLLLLFFQWLLAPFIIDKLGINIPFTPYFELAILNNFFDVIAIIPLVLYRVNDNAKSFVVVNITKTILQYVLVFIFLSKFKMGVEGSYMGKLLANLPFLIIYALIIRKYGNFKIDLTIIKSALRFSLPLLPGSIAYILIALSDRLILERYISLNDLGLYSIAFTFALALNVITQALYKAIEPVLFKVYNSDSFLETNDKLYKTYLFLIILFAFIISIFSKEVFILFTSREFHLGYKLFHGYLHQL